MSLQQIKHVSSVGRFRSCSAEGDVTFKKFTLLFGENGRGKTTLCSIFRSLQTNDPAIVLGRTTLGDTKKPNIVLQFGDGNVIFNDGGWKRTTTKLRIFDAQYVAENVYLGDVIGTDQRRNLCRMMLGRDGVLLAKAYDDADAAINGKNAAIREARAMLTGLVPLTQIDQLIELPLHPDVDNEIEKQKREVEGLKEIDNLRSQPMLESLEFPPLPLRLQNILGQTLESVSREAEKRVREHLTVHGMQGNEDWIVEGLSHLSDDNCPFCGQSTRDLDLIASYQMYFNESYAKFRSDLLAYAQLPGKHYSDDRITILGARIQSNSTAVALWARYVSFKAPETKPLGNLMIKLLSFRNEMVSLLEQKRANPLEFVRATEAYLGECADMVALNAGAAAYNDAVAAANKAIDSFKQSASPARLQSSQNALRWLELTKKRHEKPLSDSCADYKKLNEEKDALDKQKTVAREQLSAYSDGVVLSHLKMINKYLERFNAGFHLDRMRVEYSGRVPNSTFCVIINGTVVEMGSSDTPIDQPSFKNTLSAGDKSTLALAFFLTQISQEPDKAHCIVVFDDPFNSQDHFRRTCTISEIRRCGQDVAQVIVMSHDRNFLRDIWDLPLPTDNRKALWLIPFGHKDTVIAEWPIETDTETEDAANRRALIGFHQENRGQSRDIVQKLRPVIETHMKRMAPQLLANVTGLGNMLAKVRENDGPPILLDAYDDIDDINIYTRKYMHGEGKNPDTEPLHTTELMGFVSKVLVIAGH